MKKVCLIFISALYLFGMQACSNERNENDFYEEQRKNIYKQCVEFFSSVKIANFLEEKHITYECKLSVTEPWQAGEVIENLVKRISGMLGFSPEIRKEEETGHFSYLWTNEDIYVRITGTCKETQLVTEILLVNPYATQKR